MIKLSDVTMKYKASARPALSQLNLELGKGDFAFLIGPSGSGKSTFFRILLKEDKPQSGQVYVGEYHVNKMRARQVPKLRQSIGCVFQDFRLLQQKSVAENVAFALEVIGKPPAMIAKAVPEVLEYVGLEGKLDRMPYELSGGEMQRVAIARAIVNRPLVLLADEPTGNLDPDTSQEIVDVLDRVNRRGTTVVMATHDRQIVDAMRRRVIEFDSGRLVRNDAQGIYGIG